MKCSEFLHELTSYLDGVLDEKTKVELENHLSWCHNCYVVCDTTKKTIEIYRDSQLYELPEDLRSRLRSAIMTKCQQHKRRGPQSVRADALLFPACSTSIASCRTVFAPGGSAACWRVLYADG